MRRSTYESMAAVLTYPGPDYSAAMEALLEQLPAECSAHASPCVDVIRALSPTAQQELFTQTFDLNPVCSLELGWHLFGENYERGLLLVRLRRELRAAEILEHGELPDHLTYALQLLPRMEHERAEDFVTAIILPSLVKMIQAIRGKNNPYEQLLQSLAILFRLDFPNIPFPEPRVELPVLPEEVTL